MPNNKDSGMLEYSGNSPEMVKMTADDGRVLPSGTRNGYSLNTLMSQLHQFSRQNKQSGLETLHVLTGFIVETVYRIVNDNMPSDSDQLEMLMESLGRLKQAIECLQRPISRDETEGIDLVLLHQNQSARGWISEPININTLATAINESISPKAKPQHRVLIVEDGEPETKLVADLMKNGACEALSLTNPFSIIDAIRHFQPDLILMMDLNLVGAASIELTRLIRSADESVAIPIIFISAEVTQEKRLLALQAGADDFLIRPISQQHLRRMVKDHIERAKAIAANGVHEGNERSNDLPDRRAFQAHLELACNDAEKEEQFRGLLVICHGDPQSELSSCSAEDADQLIASVVDRLRPLLHEKDCLARVGCSSLAILITRHSKQELERLAALTHDAVNNRHNQSGTAEKQLGISLTQLDGCLKNADALLRHGELMAVSACQRGRSEYQHYEEATSIPVAGGDVKTRLTKDRFLHALLSGSVTLRERRFICSRNKEQARVTLDLIPQSNELSGYKNLYKTALLCELAAEFDRIVCSLGIHRLAEYAHQGKSVRLILRQSAAVLEEGDYIEFIKMELRKLQIVGTGLIMEFDLSSLASNLKGARALFGEIAALGIGISLSSFACKKSAYKALAYLRANMVRPRHSLLRAEAERIQHISRRIRALPVEIMLPHVERQSQIALPWAESADYIQADF